MLTDRIRRLVLGTDFRLRQRPRIARVSFETVAGRSFVVLPGVFHPTLFFSSELLAGAIDAGTVPPGSNVLDLGTGSGILAVFAAPFARHVDAVDSNPAAIRCARLNVLLNNCEDQITVFEGNLFTPLGGRRYDVILCNPPFYRGRPGDAAAAAWRAEDFAERFAAGLGEKLLPGGHALLVLSSVGDEAGYLAAAGSAGFAAQPIRRRNVIGEILTVYRLRRPRE